MGENHTTARTKSFYMYAQSQTLSRMHLSPNPCTGKRGQIIVISPPLTAKRRRSSGRKAQRMSMARYRDQPLCWELYLGMACAAIRLCLAPPEALRLFQANGHQVAAPLHWPLLLHEAAARLVRGRSAPPHHSACPRYHSIENSQNPRRSPLQPLCRWHPEANATHLPWTSEPLLQSGMQSQLHLQKARAVAPLTPCSRPRIHF